MNSGGKNRNNKSSKGGANRNIAVAATDSSTLIKQSKSDPNHNDKSKENPSNKIAPTAEQLRIAQMIDNTHPEKVLQEKINQVVLVTGVSTDDAIVALHDCNNDVNAAIDALLEGEDQGEWQESTKKKKKPPISKTKEEGESNKENRKLDSRDKSGSKSRGSGPSSSGKFRGRGGGSSGRGTRDNDVGEHAGTRGGSFNRRGRMTNGSAPPSRGRGMRGRAGASSHSRTFQKRQPDPPVFTETIDTWGAPEKVETNDTLHIEYWDDAQSSATTEDWESEWTGSLDKTTVFSPSASTAGNLPSVNELNISGGSLNNCPDVSSMNSVLNQVNNASSSLSSGLSSNVDSVLSMNQTSQQLGNVAGTASHSYPGGAPSSSSLTQGQTIDLAALLRKAAPHSTLGRLPNSQMVDASGLTPSLVGDVKGNLLSGISSSVAVSMNSNMLPSNTPDGTVVSATQPSYSSTAMNNSIFSTSDLGALTSISNDGKGLNLSSQRAKPQRSRLPHSSRIPSQAVEMPEVAMAALDMQFTGLEFGTETFDFGSEMKPLMPIASSSVGNLDVSSAGSASKDLTALGSSLPQPQTLGSQPIPFPTQQNERKSQTGSLLSASARSSSVSDSASSLSDHLTKKDSSSVGSGPSLGNLVGSVSSSTHSYQGSAAGVAYGSKVSSFPSPPSHHFSQNSVQNYSNTGSSGVNSTYVGTTGGTGNNMSTNNGNVNQTNSVSGYSSGYSSNNVQYQNSYVNVSSHSLSSLNAPKAHSTMKDQSQVNYNSDATGVSSNLGSSLSTTSGVANNNSSLTLGLGSPPSSSPLQPSKNSVSAGKSVNSLVSGPPGVQRHSSAQPTLSQHLPAHHHLQQQQQVAQQSQTQQLLPGPSQYVSPQQATLPGTLPPPFYNVQQPAMYSLEELQYFQQRIPHMPQASSTLPGGRGDSSLSSGTSYSVTDSSKFRSDHNSSPVSSTVGQQQQQQQGGAGGAAFMTAPGNASMAPFYMYQTMPGVPSTFPQYGTPAIIQIPTNTHTGSSTSQFPGPPKIPYGGTSAYYDTISQNQDFKSYGSGSQGQSKSGPPNSAVSGSTSSSDMASYKNHLSKVGRSYDKQAYHTGTPPPFNLAGSGTNPIAAAAAANYAPMFIPTMPAAQHHSTLMHHHQLHQDGSSSGGQRGGSTGSQSKGPSKGPYSGSYWAS